MNKIRVLLVDDNDHQHELFRVYCLASEKVEVVHVHTIEEACEQASASKIDLILLDSRLHPFHTYKETVPLLREAGFEGRIVVISADVDDQIFADAKKHGVHKCVNKFDFALDNFDERIGELLD